MDEISLTQGYKAVARVKGTVTIILQLKLITHLIFELLFYKCFVQILYFLHQHYLDR